MSGKKWMAAIACSAAVAVCAPRSIVRADNITWTGSGDGSSWTDPLNWEDSNDPPNNVVPGTADQAFINGVASINLSSTAGVGSIAIGSLSPDHPDGGVATLNILPGANFTVNNTSRIGRGANPVGTARGEVIQTGGSVSFPNSSRLGLSFDSRTPPEVNADSLYSISGGSLVMAGTGSFQVGRTLDSGGNPITYNRAEFRVVGSGATEISANRLSLDGGAAQGTPVVKFVIDSGGVTPITLRDNLRLNLNATLEIGVMSSTVPAGDINLIACDYISGDLTEFVGLPDLSDISSIFQNKLYEWTLDYTDMLDDGVIDSFVTLTMPRQFVGGDANKDNRVNLSDFNILAANFGGSGLGWTEADFNGDGLVNLADFNILAGNFGFMALPSDPTPDDWSALAAAAAVPEPASLALLALAAGTLRRRRC